MPNILDLDLALTLMVTVVVFQTGDGSFAAVGRVRDRVARGVTPAQTTLSTGIRSM